MAEAEEGGRRPRRHCAAKRSAVPSAVHYVGYVEDDETPEMIMKKFEELEKVKAAAAAAPAAVVKQDSERAGEETEMLEEGERPFIQEDARLAGLTDAQLLEVFKQTSIFNVRSALAGNESLMDGSQMEEGMERWSDGEGSEDEGLWNDVRGFWSDEEGEDSEGNWRKGRKAKGGKREPRVRGMTHSKPRHDIVTHYNASTQALIRRKVRVVDKEALLHIKVPWPLPLSWGRTVQPYVPHELRSDRQAVKPDENVDSNTAQPSCQYLEQDSMLATDWSSLRKNYQGLLINPGWEIPGAAGAKAVTALAKIPLPKLCPVGFVFIWIDKQHISAVVKQMSRWGFVYIENLTWVLLHANNSILRLKSDYAQRSHLTLFLFRKDGQGKEIELRHQRNPDVTFDWIRSSSGQAFDPPEEAYVAIETLLPTGKGNFLELWSKVGARRPGWTQIAQREYTHKN